MAKKADVSINELQVGGLIKHRLKNNGIITINQLDKALKDDIDLKNLKAASKLILKDALKIYYADNNKEKKGDDNAMEIKTKSGKNSEKKSESEIKPTFNRYDMVDLLLRLVVEKSNDKDTPKYRLEKLPKFPSYDIFYDDEFVYFRMDYLNDLMEKELDGYDIVTTADSNVANKPIFMATTYMKYNSPLYSTVSKGKYYCFSNYKWILPNDDKYIKLYINKLEAKMNVKLDFSMNDTLTEEWIQFRKELDDEMAKSGDLSWDNGDRSLAEIWANQRKYADALKTVISYTKKYVVTYGNYKNIEEDVIDKLKLYSNKIKDNKLKTSASIILSDIEMDNDEHNSKSVSLNTSKQEHSDSIKALEEVLERDLVRLPENIREDITKEMLSDIPSKDKTKAQYSIALNGCKQIGNIAILMFSIAIEISRKGRFDFENSIEVGTYQFTTDDIENGTLTIASDNVDKEILKKQLIGLI